MPKHKAFGAAALVFLASVYIFPVVWLLTISLKFEVDIFSVPPKWVFTPTLEHFRNVIADSAIGLYLGNSLLIAAGATILALAAGLPAAYGCARFPSRVTNRFVLSLFLLRMLPGIAVAVPIYLVAAGFGLVDSYLTLILVHVCVVMPIVVLMLQNFILEIPRELEEAAMVDGCSRPAAFFRIVLPLMGPGLVSSAVLAFIISWNEFLFAMILSGSGTQTLPVGVTAFMADKTVRWGELAAVGVIMITPTAIFSFVVQKYLVRGLTMGAVKE